MSEMNKRVVLVVNGGCMSIKKYEGGALVDEWADIEVPVKKAIYPGVSMYMNSAVAWACDYNPPSFSKARALVKPKRKSWFSRLLDAEAV